MDDLDPELKDDEELEEDPDDLLLDKKLKGDDESADALADEEDELLPEDSYDDIDKW